MFYVIRKKQEIVHFFCNCEIANTIWQSLAKWIYEEWNVSINLHNLPPYKVLFNDAHDNIIDFISVIVLITKYHLYSVQCQNKRPSTAVIKSEVTFIQKIEYDEAVKTGNFKMYCNQTRK